MSAAVAKVTDTLRFVATLLEKQNRDSRKAAALLLSTTDQDVVELHALPADQRAGGVDALLARVGELKTQLTILPVSINGLGEMVIDIPPKTAAYLQFSFNAWRDQRPLITFEGSAVRPDVFSRDPSPVVRYIRNDILERSRTAVVAAHALYAHGQPLPMKLARLNYQDLGATIVGWEDDSASSSDFDFNDTVVEVWLVPLSAAGSDS